MTPTAADLQTLTAIADGFSRQQRSPVLHHPGELSLGYEDVTFPASDGVPLSGWLIRSPHAVGTIIANHPMGFTRSGLPTHLEPWQSMWQASGNGFEVNLVPDYKILHDAGYNVVAYDLRNHGLSSTANGGVASSGIFESRDVLGSVRFVRDHPDLRDVPIGLFSRCLGCSSTLCAIDRYPREFADVRCLVGSQPVTARVIMAQRLGLLGLEQLIDVFDDLVIERTGIGFAERQPQAWARSVTLPTYLYQVHDDALTDPSDVQNIFDNLASDHKRLDWIEGTTARWDGYMEFQRRPSRVLDWFATHLTS